MKNNMSSEETLVQLDSALNDATVNAADVYTGMEEQYSILAQALEEL